MNVTIELPHQTVINSTTDHQYTVCGYRHLQGVVNALITLASARTVITGSVFLSDGGFSFIIFYVRAKIICENLYKVGKLWSS